MSHCDKYSVFIYISHYRTQHFWNGGVRYVCTLFFEVPQHNRHYTGKYWSYYTNFVQTIAPPKLKLPVNILKHLYFSALLLFHTMQHPCSCSRLVFWYFFFSALLLSQLWPSKRLLVPASWRRKNEMFGEKQRKKISSYGAGGKLVLELRQVHAQRQMSVGFGLNDSKSCQHKEEMWVAVTTHNPLCHCSKHPTGHCRGGHGIQIRSSHELIT